MDEITKKIIEISAKILGFDNKDITLNSNYTADLEADSLDCVEITMELEKEFNIEIPEEDMFKPYTVNEVVEYIKKKLEVKTAIPKLKIGDAVEIGRIRYEVYAKFEYQCQEHYVCKKKSNLGYSYSNIIKWQSVSGRWVVLY